MSISKIVSKARAVVPFLEKTTQEQAWGFFAGMFRPGGSPLPGRSSLSAERRGLERAPRRGDKFKSRTHADEYELTITYWSPPHTLNYTVAAASDDYRYPRETFSILIDTCGDSMVLQLELTLRRHHRPFLARLFDLDRGDAGKQLQGMLCQRGQSSPAWLGDWLNLPVVYSDIEYQELL